jgi:hypothetical protein
MPTALSIVGYRLMHKRIGISVLLSLGIPVFVCLLICMSSHTVYAYLSVCLSVFIKVKIFLVSLLSYIECIKGKRMEMVNRYRPTFI